MRMLNHPKSEPKSAFEEQTGIPLEKKKKSEHPTLGNFILSYRVAICKGPTGYYLVTCTTADEANTWCRALVELGFVCWADDWKYV